MVKIFIRRGCSRGVNRRGVLDSGWHVADRAQVEQGAEDQNVVLTLAVAFFVIMLLELGEPVLNKCSSMGRHSCLTYRTQRHKSVPVLAEWRKSRFTPIWSSNSCGPLVVILKETAEALATLDR